MEVAEVRPREVELNDDRKLEIDWREAAPMETDDDRRMPIPSAGSPPDRAHLE